MLVQSLGCDVDSIGPHRGALVCQLDLVLDVEHERPADLDVRGTFHVGISREATEPIGSQRLARSQSLADLPSWLDRIRASEPPLASTTFARFIASL